MKKLFFFFLFLFYASHIKALPDSGIHKNEYFDFYFPNGRDEGFEYVNYFVNQGNKINISVSYFKFEKGYKLAKFVNDTFVNEINFIEDTIFNRIKKDKKCISKIPGNSNLTNGLKEYQDTVSLILNLAIRVSDLHYNHFKFTEDNPYYIECTNKKLFIGCLCINLLMRHIERLTGLKNFKEIKVINRNK